MARSPLTACLRAALAAHPDGSVCVGFSGGPDSSALLHALASLREARTRGLRAMHVDHALHADSAQWAAHCEQFCEVLDIPLDVRTVSVDRSSGHGLEAAARDARYAAFAEALGPDENLLLAHHRDDQAETVLLKLLRGAGPHGLGGMRERRAFANGWLWRPLLDLPRATLLDYVAMNQLRCIDDPGNHLPELMRNFLRAQILPRLHAHWPQATQSLAHSAHLSRVSADYLDAHAHVALEDLRDGEDALDAAGWLDLHEALRGVVLEHWLHARGLPAPGRAQAAQLLRQVRDALPDRVPCVRWPGAELHRWRGRLHALAPLPSLPDVWQAPWSEATLVLPGGAGTLQWSQPLLSAPPALQVRLGETGVRLQPVGDQLTRKLRDLFQQAAVPPWWRRRCPLIYAPDDTLLAVADLWRTPTGDALFKSLGAHPVWQPVGWTPRHA